MKHRFTCTEGNSNKFWEIEITGKNFTVTYGRLGTEGQSKTKTFDTEEKCQKEANRLIAEKTKKGYKETAGSTATPDKVDTKNKLKKKTQTVQKEKKFFKTGWKIKNLYNGCILASIANAISAARYPLFAYEHSWDGINYSANDTSGTRCTVTFSGDYCVAAFRNDKSERRGENSKYVADFFKIIPRDIIDDIKKIAIDETLQYLLMEFENEVDGKYTCPVITTLLWGKNNELFTEDTFEDFLEYGGEILATQAMSMKSAIDEWE